MKSKVMPKVSGIGLPPAEAPVRGYANPAEAFGDAFGPPPSSGSRPSDPIGDRYAPSSGLATSTSAGTRLSASGSESSPPYGPHQSHERHRPDASRELAQAAEPVDQTVTRLPPVDNRWPSTYSEQGPGIGDAAMRYPSTGYAAHDAE